MSKIRCDDCGQRIGVEALIPSEAWEAIARGSYALCPPCIDARLEAAGITAPAVLFYRGRALLAPINEAAERASRAWRPGPACVARGPVGNPLLRGDSEVWA